ncbi:hypothetical protein BJF93_00005 [Xaviernesmea oryzae]|uniref:Uncharacterized protein n=1 Tax=Xaviernesmea oryzae TaxID=464029 RepID=A0A1Q9AXI6_9HYPH|nr:hypothetical protein BJF93_00005 [Xaviernesmea oryzae]
MPVKIDCAPDIGVRCHRWLRLNIFCYNIFDSIDLITAISVLREMPIGVINLVFILTKFYVLLIFGFDCLILFSLIIRIWRSRSGGSSASTFGIFFCIAFHFPVTHRGSGNGNDS